MENNAELFAGLSDAIFGVPSAPKTESTEGKENTENLETKDEGFTLAELSIPDDKFNGKTEEVEEDLLNEIKNKGKEVTEEVKETKEIKNDEEDSSDKSEVYKAISLLLKEDGLIEKEFSSPEEMFNTFSELVKNEIEEYKETLPLVIKDLLNSYEEGVPLNKLIDYKSKQIEYSNIDDTDIEENEDLAKELVINHLKSTTRFSDEKIKKEIKRLEDLGELVDEAKNAKSELIELNKQFEAEEKERQKQELVKQKAENEKVIKEIHKTITSTKEIIPGIKLPEKEAEEIYKMVVTPVEIRGNVPVSAAAKIRESDPVKFDMTLNYLIKKGVFEGNWDFIIKKAETKSINKLEKQLEEHASKLINKGGASANAVGSNKTIDALKALVKK